jgi:hypothetical protein
MLDFSNRFCAALPLIAIFAVSAAVAGCVGAEETPGEETDSELGESEQALAPQTVLNCGHVGPTVNGAPMFRCEATNLVPIYNQQWHYRIWNMQGVPLQDSGWWWGNSSFTKSDCVTDYVGNGYYHDDYYMLVEYRAYNADGVTTTSYPQGIFCRIP